MEYTELDMSLRLVEIFYDMTWAFFMSTNVDTVAKRMDRHRSTSSSASVSSVNTDGASVMNKSMEEKMSLLTTDLKKVRRLIQQPQFKEICGVSLTRNDDLYPGFKDCLFIAKDLLSGKLSAADLDALTITPVFQSIYYRFCDFLIGTKTGYQMMKMIVMPTRTSQAVYDICRQKFCRVVCDEEAIVQDGLADLVATMAPVDASPPPPPPSSPQSPPRRPKTPLTVVDSPPRIPAEEAPPSPTFSMVSKTLHKRAPFAAAFPRKSERGDDGVRFPLIEMSDSDDSDVSSLEEEI